MTDLRDQSAADLGRAIGTGEVDPVTLTESFLKAIDGHPSRDEIYSAVTPDRAMAEAEAAKARAEMKQRLGPLDGVPISWKDLFDSAGTETAAGSRLLEGRVPETDARVLANAMKAGLICLGKTHMSELAFSGLGLNPMTATPPNVNDAALVPGGSSSGAAASVAFGLAACGIGSDTGGSVRIPSAWNDLVGLKTTHGRVSNDGVVPLCARFDTVGPLSRTVEDCALVLAALEGGKAADLRGVSLKGKRFGVVQNVAFDDIRDSPLKAFEDAVERFRDAGAEIVPFEAPELSEAMPFSGILFTAEAYGQWSEVIEAAPDKMFPAILERFRSGEKFAAHDYVAGWFKLEELRAAWHARTKGFDAVICPTAPILPPDRDRLLTDNEYYVTENLLALRNTRIGNLMGLCGVSLPTGKASCGVMLLGAPYAEERLLRVAKAAEDVL
ncbi:MAG: amidase family protein [Pseudomonadota bacterium]